MSIDINSSQNKFDEIKTNVFDDLRLVDSPNDVTFDTVDIESKIDDGVFKFFNSLNLKFESTIVWKHTIDSKVAIENILKELFPNETNIDMEKIYALGDLEKSMIAHKLSSVQPIPKSLRRSSVPFFDSKDQKRKTFPKTYVEINDLLNNWTIVWGKELPFELIHSFRQRLIWAKSPLTLETFTSFYKEGDSVPLMPNIASLATWDLTGTSWTGWEYNLWRWEWMYSPERYKQMNYINFWPLSSPMEILVNAEWIDVKDGIGWWKIEFVFEKNNKKHIIKWEYSSNWLRLLESNPKLEGVELVGNKIIVPKKYSWWNISVNTESAQYNDGWYDEVNFDLYIKNWDIWQEIGTLKDNAKANKELWKYNLNDLEWNHIGSMFKSIKKYENNTKLRPIPLDVSIGADKTLFTDPNKFLEENWNYKKDFDTFIQNKFPFPQRKERRTTEDVKKYNKDFDIQKNLRISSLQKFDKIVEDFMSTVDVSDFAKNSPDKEIQQKAQKMLIQNRFISFLFVATQDEAVFNSINDWKYNITPKFVSNERVINVETKMSYIK